MSVRRDSASPSSSLPQVLTSRPNPRYNNAVKGGKDIERRSSKTNDGMEYIIPRWLLNPKYSDLKIKCGDRTYSAHRLVVCSNSAYFATICDGGFKEAATQEITLNEHTPLEVRKMLQYLYMEDYALEDQDVAAYLQYLFSTEFPVDSEQSTDNRERSNDEDQECLARFHAQMYSVGDYFQISGLKVTAQRYFHTALDSIRSRYAFYVAVEGVYSSTPSSDRGLRDMVVNLVMNYPLRTRGGDEPMLYDGLLRDVPGFAIDLSLEFVDMMRMPC